MSDSMHLAAGSSWGWELGEDNFPCGLGPPSFFSCKIRTTVRAGRMPGTAGLSPGQTWPRRPGERKLALGGKVWGKV